MGFTWGALADTWAGLADNWVGDYANTIKVELAQSKAFTLDDPVAGVIGSTEYTIGGIEFADVTAKVKRVSITRGKNRDLDRFNAGTLSVVFDNTQRDFDPLFPQSPYAGNIVPRRDIRVSGDDFLTYVGKVLDWNLNYSVTLQSEATVEAADGLTSLAQQVLTPGTATPEDTGARITAVLDMPSVDWPADLRSIDEGEATLGADVFEGNALNYLQKVESSEAGLFFINREGKATFRNRLASPETSNALLFSDDGQGIPFGLTTVEYGSELLFNQIIVNTPDGGAVANGLLSQTQYGILETTVDTLLSTTAQGTALANFLLDRYEQPEYRFARISVTMNGLSAPQRAQLYQLEMGSVISIRFTPNGVGDPIERSGRVIAIGHEIDTNSHIMTLGVGSVQDSLFIIGDPTFGIIEGPGVLAF
jgi:hypothetical protein